MGEPSCAATSLPHSPSMPLPTMGLDGGMYRHDDDCLDGDPVSDDVGITGADSAAGTLLGPKSAPHTKPSRARTPVIFKEMWSHTLSAAPPRPRTKCQGRATESAF